MHASLSAATAFDLMDFALTPINLVRVYVCVGHIDRCSACARDNADQQFANDNYAWLWVRNKIA